MNVIYMLRIFYPKRIYWKAVQISEIFIFLEQLATKLQYIHNKGRT